VPAVALTPLCDPRHQLLYLTGMRCW